VHCNNGSQGIPHAAPCRSAWTAVALDDVRALTRGVRTRPVSWSFSSRRVLRLRRRTGNRNFIFRCASDFPFCPGMAAKRRAACTPRTKRRYWRRFVGDLFRENSSPTIVVIPDYYLRERLMCEWSRIAMAAPAASCRRSVDGCECGCGGVMK
jgi:hypothetical protein